MRHVAYTTIAVDIHRFTDVLKVTFILKNCLTVAYPTALLSLNQRYEGYFIKKISLPSKIVCRLTDVVLLTDGYLGVA